MDVRRPGDGVVTMKLTRAEVNLLLEHVFGTEEHELTCGDALDGFAALAEQELRGGAVSDRTRRIAEHIRECPECLEEYESLLVALEDAPRDA
jgi:hypothetical protein